jgi:hypothetical protein
MPQSQYQRNGIFALWSGSTRMPRTLLLGNPILLCVANHPKVKILFDSVAMLPNKDIELELTPR